MGEWVGWVVVEIVCVIVFRSSIAAAASVIVSLCEAARRLGSSCLEWIAEKSVPEVPTSPAQVVLAWLLLMPSSVLLWLVDWTFLAFALSVVAPSEDLASRYAAAVVSLALVLPLLYQRATGFLRAGVVSVTIGVLAGASGFTYVRVLTTPTVVASVAPEPLEVSVIAGEQIEALTAGDPAPVPAVLERSVIAAAAAGFALLLSVGSLVLMHFSYMWTCPVLPAIVAQPVRVLLWLIGGTLFVVEMAAQIPTRVIDGALLAISRTWDWLSSLPVRLYTYFAAWKDRRVARAAAAATVAFEAENVRVTREAYAEAYRAYAAAAAQAEHATALELKRSALANATPAARSVFDANAEQSLTRFWSNGMTDSLGHTR